MRLPVPVPTLGGKQLWGDVFLHQGYRIQRHVRGRHRLLDPRDRRLAVGTYPQCREVFEQVRRERRLPTGSAHLVLLLHGIFRSKDSFGPLTRALRAAGFEAHAVNYPSTRQSLEAHADQLDLLLDRLEGVEQVSFVGHSLGGIVTRTLLGRERAAWRDRITVNRVVMMGTPNQGALIADRLARVAPFRTVAGPSLDQLHPERRTEVAPLDVPFGLVTGGTGDERGFNPLLPGDNDMTVTVSEAALDGAEDHLFVKAVHTFIMVHPEVVEGTIRYLQTGSFTAPEEDPQGPPARSDPRRSPPESPRDPPDPASSPRSDT